MTKKKNTKDKTQFAYQKNKKDKKQNPVNDQQQHNCTKVLLSIFFLSSLLSNLGRKQFQQAWRENTQTLPFFFFFRLFPSTKHSPIFFPILSKIHPIKHTLMLRNTTTCSIYGLAQRWMLCKLILNNGIFTIPLTFCILKIL